MNEEVQFIKRFFYEMERKDISYCILRNADEVQKGDAHDIDMVVDFQQFEDVFASLIDAAGEKWKIHRMLEKDCGNLIAIHLHTVTEMKPILLHFDFFKAFGWNGFQLIPYSKMLENRRKKEWLYEACCSTQAVTMLFSRLLYHGYVKRKYQPYISETFRSSESKVKTLLGQFLPDECMNKVYEAACNGDWNTIETNSEIIRQNVEKQARQRQKHTQMKCMIFAVKRLLRRVGLIIYMSEQNLEKLTQIMDFLGRTFQPEDFKTVLKGTSWIKKRIWLSKGCLLIQDKRPITAPYIEITEADSAKKASVDILRKLSERQGI